MKSITNSDLLDMLTKDYIGRNQQLSTLVRFINSFNEPTTIAIDGSWGSGKTVFVKQLELLNTEEQFNNKQPPSIDEVALEDFRNNYSVYYFNAWENDFLDDPLQALLYNLINDMSVEGLQEKSLKNAVHAIDIPALVKNISKNGIDIDKLTSQEKMITEIKTVIDRKQHAHKIIEEYQAKTEKKLLFIIDELDRCKPSFAVNLLEVIKHYFNKEDIVFVIATDNTQLAHTVSKYYGVNFNGATYLNKFFDYNMQLSRVDRERYILNYLNVPADMNATRRTPSQIADYLNMPMREIESYFKALELVSEYMTSDSSWDDNAATRLGQWVFVPLALALKISRPHLYQSFISGAHKDIFTSFVPSSRATISLARYYAQTSEDRRNYNEQIATQTVMNAYDYLFSARDREMKEFRKEFWEVINLISSYSAIKADTEAHSNV